MARAAAFIAGCLLLVAPAPGQTTPPISPRQDARGQGASAVEGIVEEVVFTGSKRMSEEALRLQVRTQKGKPYSPRTVDEDMKALARFLVWAEVHAEKLPSGGLRVVFKLEDIPTVRRVRFVGNKEIEESDLRKALGLTETGSIPAPTVRGNGLRLFVRKLEDKYQEEGFLHVEIDAQVEKDGDDFGLVFRIIEGPKVHVDHVDFVGLEQFAPRHLRDLMKTSRSFLFFTQTFKPEVLDEDVSKIQEFLHDEGYLNARVAVESVTSSADGESVDILIRIEQGQRFTIRSVKLEGNAQFPTRELIDAGLIKMHPGMPYRQTLYRKDADRIRKYYRHRGFVECSVSSHAEEAYALDKPEVDLTIRITEDQPKVVRDVRVVGNRNTKDEVVRRELDLHPGQLFDGDEMDLAEDRLRATGFFSDDQGRPLAWVEQKKTDDPRAEDIVLRVDDGTNGVFQLFGGLASGQGFFVGVSLSIENFDILDPPSTPGGLFQEFIDQRAFHGGGQKLNLTANPGNKYSNYLINFSEPYLNGPARNPFFMNVNLHLKEYVSTFYDEETTGAIVTIGKRLSRRTSVSLGLRNDRIVIDNIPPQYLDTTTLGGRPIEDLITTEGGNSVRGLIGDYDWQHLDSLRNPTSGARMSLGGELLGGPFGAQVNAFKLSASAEWLIPVYENEEEQRQVLSTRGAFGFAHEFGDSEDVPFFERYFAGGPGAFLQLRGFEWRGVGPHDEGFQQGGNAGWVVNTEYVFPLFDIYDSKLRENTPFLRGLVFMDQGMLASDWASLLDDRWRMSLGVGIRLRIPIQILSAPLELYYSVPMQRRGDDERESFQINFSTKF